jgi:hypothetical protein
MGRDPLIYDTKIKYRRVLTSCQPHVIMFVLV